MKSCAAFLIALLLAADAAPDFIPARCCVTNGCCFRIAAADVTRLPNGLWRINATGEELRSLPSYDGEIWRCACDLDAVVGRYVVHAGARTWCLLVPPETG